MDNIMEIGDENRNEQNVCPVTPFRRNHLVEDDELVNSLLRVSLGKRPPPSPVVKGFSLGPETPGGHKLPAKRHSHQASPAKPCNISTIPTTWWSAIFGLPILKTAI
jgi:hypothetical protein